MSDAAVLSIAPALRCTSCGTELAATLLVCPACHALVHRARLEALARAADEATASNDRARALSLWREAMELLPAGSRQRDAVAQRIDAMQQSRDDAAQPRSGWGKITGGLAALGIALVTKAKLLLIGLTKLGTIATMFVSLGFYWRMWGWQFAAAILVAIYIHEIGHVAEIRRLGMPADAPMFIPGLGAFIRLQLKVMTPSEDARIGLAGPVWGLGASLAALALSLARHSDFWFGIAQVSAWINLFNMMPIWQLDGSRGFHALSRTQRWMAVAVIAISFALSGKRMLVLVGLVAVWRAFEKKNVQTQHDWRAFATYAVLIAAFAALAIR
jgi:Zn-dependent protease